MSEETATSYMHSVCHLSLHCLVEHVWNFTSPLSPSSNMDDRACMSVQWLAPPTECRYYNLLCTFSLTASAMKEPWEVKVKRIRESSPYGLLPNWSKFHKCSVYVGRKLWYAIHGSVLDIELFADTDCVTGCVCVCNSCHQCMPSKQYLNLRVWPPINALFA